MSSVSVFLWSIFFSQLQSHSLPRSSRLVQLLARHRQSVYGKVMIVIMIVIMMMIMIMMIDDSGIYL